MGDPTGIDSTGVDRGVAVPTGVDRGMGDPTGTGRVRWRIDLGYDGSAFSGWAAQPGRRTVQGELTDAITTVLRLAEPVELVCAGRTDAGVHARGQVAHVDLPVAPGPAFLGPAFLGPPPLGPPPLGLEGQRLTHRLRRLLPADLTVRSVTRAAPGFDARFAATWRRYVYRLADGSLDPLCRHDVAAIRRPLDLDRLNAAAATLLGLRDFAPFCRRREGASTIRTLLRCDAARVAASPFDPFVAITVVADAFCHSMVRSLVGALVAVADGSREPAWLATVAAGPVRAGAVHVMPPHGLTLEEVGYPADDALAARARTARAYRTLPEARLATAGTTAGTTASTSDGTSDGPSDGADDGGRAR